MDTTEQSMSSNGMPETNSDFYRFSVIPESDVMLEILEPENKDHSISPICCHTDDLFHKEFFTYDTDRFIHRVGIYEDGAIGRNNNSNINNYIRYYYDSFNSTLEDYIKTEPDRFMVFEKKHDNQIVIAQYQCAFDTIYGKLIDLPIVTTLVQYDDCVIAIRSIPSIQNEMWLLYPALINRHLYETNEKATLLINRWTYRVSEDCKLIFDEIDTILSTMSVQRGCQRCYPAKEFEYENPIYTIVGDHTASHMTQFEPAGKYIAYVVAGQAYSYSLESPHHRGYAKVTFVPQVGRIGELQISIGEECRLKVHTESYSGITIETNLENADVYRRRLHQVYFQ